MALTKDELFKLASEIALTSLYSKGGTLSINEDEALAAIKNVYKILKKGNTKLNK